MVLGNEPQPIIFQLSLDNGGVYHQTDESVADVPLIDIPSYREDIANPK